MGRYILDNGYQVVNNIVIDTSSWSTAIPYTLGVKSLILEDIVDYVPVERGETVGIVNWQCRYYVSAINARTSRFISALPKYALGSWQKLNKGGVVDEGFINFESQLLCRGITWSDTLQGTYPSRINYPSPGTENGLQPISTLVLSDGSSPGDDLTVNLLAVNIADVTLEIIYVWETELGEGIYWLYDF